jgi:ADP-heptose:LPS heptosyltransferase
MWRERRYDLAINFEGDIRSNLLIGLTRAPRRVGFGMAGGAAALTDVVSFDPAMHTADNTLRLVRTAFGPAENNDTEHPRPLDALSRSFPRFGLPEQAHVRASDLLSPLRGSRSSEAGDAVPIVGLHPSGGRQIKQWDVTRLADVGLRLARERGARLVVTGSAEDRQIVERVIAEWPADVASLDLSGAVNVLELAAVLQRLDLFITPDTGPMHLAGAMGTPVVGIFGPSDPARYAPIGPATRIVRIDLPCSPCNRIRLPPERCVGHVPDCLKGIEANRVFDAAVALLIQPRSDTRSLRSNGVAAGNRLRD